MGTLERARFIMVFKKVHAHIHLVLH